MKYPMANETPKPKFVAKHNMNAGEFYLCVKSSSSHFTEDHLYLCVKGDNRNNNYLIDNRHELFPCCNLSSEFKEAL